MLDIHDSFYVILTRSSQIENSLGIKAIRMATSPSSLANISVQTYILSLDSPALPQCLLQIVLLQKQTMLWLGQAGAQARLCVDWGIAMPGSGVSESGTVSSCYEAGTYANPDSAIGRSTHVNKY